ncbi:hypothetical protein GTPT_1642 [Tatumella ptyseos ATCC 33301]|uniref:ArsR family transcriptional regulator n=2 Tax=Tatumella ptyseos TaxID=82987 RepID=A0A085JGW5_9GAMM|nr:DUF1833 family protein [Tatumella ptyseos]KFD19711.1 hypothetical protein GTPT_1642 [Tatumella ptyseos ATCC 33301]SQK75724.1 Domain of uncharacterised function (DUF1833) [Tatumella ptyseos]
MTVLNRLYASSGPEVLINTLQINVGDDVYYLCQGYDDIVATDESGNSLTFTACAMDVALPARNTDGTQDLNIAISNVDGIVSTTIRNALNSLSGATVTYRQYISTDLSAPSSTPYTMAIKTGQWTSLQVQITAGYMNWLDTAWPRYRYTLPDHPGLRYIS